MKLNKNQRLLLIVGIVLGGGLGIFFIGDYVGVWSIAPTGTTSTVKTTSTFALMSYPDGEDVSNFVEMDIWIPKSSATFEDVDDKYTLTNFERAESGKDADDISIDLRDEPYIWAEVTGNTVYANTFVLITGGVNYDYVLNVYQQTSDVNFNILDAAMNASFYAGYQGDSNFTATLDAPHYTTTVAELHYGVGWETSATDFADYTTAQKEVVWDEKNWRVQAPVYDPTLDTADHEYIEGLEANTDYFAIKITFNDSVSTVDSNILEVNATIAKGEKVKIVYSGTLIYLIVNEIINFESGVYDFKFEMQMAANISISSVYSGRLTVPDDSPGAFSTYSAIGV